MAIVANHTNPRGSPDEASQAANPAPEPTATTSLSTSTVSSGRKLPVLFSSSLLQPQFGLKFGSLFAASA